MHILLVEDNEGDIELTTRAFKKIQPAVSLAVVYDGIQALDYLAKHGAYSLAKTPDLILLDLNTPRMGGRQFLEIVKQDAQHRLIPVAVLTSSNAPGDINDAYQRHANCYILKPFNFESFTTLAQQIKSFWGDVVRLPVQPGAVPA